MNSFNLILASASPYRAKLLARLNVPFRIQAANIDEKVAVHESPHDYVERMSKQKAALIAKDY